MFREKPAIHRFPGAMADAHPRPLRRSIVDEYGGRAERVWTEAADGADLSGASPGCRASAT